MVETTTGRLTQLASLQTRDFPEVVWQREGVALFSPGWVQLWSYRDGSIQKSPSAAELWGNTSPDGRFELGWRLSGAGVAKGRLAPVSVVLHDLGTHTERSYADVVQGTVTWAGVPLRYAWEAGGEAVLLWDEATGQTVRLDLASGERRPSASLLPEAEPFPWRGPAGGWQYRSNGWGPVIVRSPGGGRESTFGRGLVLGWQGDHRLLVIRWANWDACKLTGSI
jgi:hypothetical protein